MAENLPHHTPVTTAMAAVDWEDEDTRRVQEQFPAVVFRSYLDQRWMETPVSGVVDLLLHLRDAEQFDMLTDLTAVDRPNDAERFEVVYMLYSFARNERIRVKTRVAEGEAVPSAAPAFAGANWLEREVFDMFGIRFSGHPGLKRILMPEDWNGFPLLKNKSIVEVDDAWVQEHLGIDSGHS